MGGGVSFEILSSKAGKWTIEAVRNDKQDALKEARSLLASRHHLAIKFLEEKYESETNSTATKVIFSGKKGEAKKKPGAPEAMEKKASQPDEAGKRIIPRGYAMSSCLSWCWAEFC